ncbi:MAG: YkgJ family cysteine cluster protein, partial [Pyrinomonadaceae bacterium]
PLSILSPFLVERLVTTRSAAVPDCVTCGACCAFPMAVSITENEAARIGNYTEVVLDREYADVVVGRFIPRAENDKCVNLDGKLGERIGCAIYEERPKCCREFDAGSDRCHEFRRIYGLEPQLTETEVVAAITKLKAKNSPTVIKYVSIVKAGSGNEDTFESRKALRLKIVAVMTDDKEHEIHSYDAAKEVWTESEFLGLSLDGARTLLSAGSLKN